MPAIDVRARPARLDRPVLVSSLVSGAVLLLVLALLGSWPLSLIGVPYVVAASVFLAAATARQLTLPREALAWAAPWLAAVALWAWVLHGVEGADEPSPISTLWFAAAIATPGYVVWQVAALAVRQVMGLVGRAKTS